MSEAERPEGLEPEYPPTGRSITYDHLSGKIDRDEYYRLIDQQRLAHGLPVFPREVNVLIESNPTLEGPDAEYLGGRILKEQYMDEIDRERVEHGITPLTPKQREYFKNR